MAVWAGLGQVATVAQMVGVDAGGLISMIIQAAETAHRNKKKCKRLAHRVSMIADLLPHLQLQDPEVALPLSGLEDALREAHGLVLSCQGRSAAYRFIMAGRHAERFQDVQGRIDAYLIVFPMVSHIAITRRLDQMCHIQRQLSANASTTGPGCPAIALLSAEAAPPPEVEDGPHISVVVANLERVLKLACS
ncbi:hypothetical protein QYE76_057205 [Lolium multiflorum]|uniref:MCAfunc domain-containing protein n=1 Tax=Lolium multiflorum TaxID=4521 RepID=A0AAD8T322_LOLMU|nr:hypothetical protein QYE76_057205 [Lolium multiflorum]